MKIAVYGTLKSMYGNNRLMQGSTLVGTGWITGHRLYEAGIPFVVKDNTADYSIQVEVYEVPEDQLPRIDSLEGHPTWYKREPTDVIMEDSTSLSSEVYKMAHQPEGTIENITGVF